MVHDDRSYERRLPASPGSLAEFRQTLRDWLSGAVDDPERRYDIVLAASELAAAAIRSVASPDAAVAVHAWVDDDSVVVESRGEAPQLGFAPLPARLFEGGDGERGFSIVAALSEVFAVKDMPSGVLVRARLPRGRFDPVPAG